MSRPAAALEIRGLRVDLASGAVVVDDVDLTIEPGEALGLVGESGSGKTTTALAALGYCRPGLRISGGAVHVDGHSLIGARERVVRPLRGRVVSYVSQDPSTALNPALRIGQQVLNLLRTHAEGSEHDAALRAAFERVHLPSEPAFVRRFPHQLSGGQQQRVAIALALACKPPLVVLDEPTTGLDVVTQEALLLELERIRAEEGTAVLYVSHDLAVVRELCDRLAVMYAGTIVEEGSASDVFAAPRHPYSAGLIAAIPDHLGPYRPRGIEGAAARPARDEAGCSFAPRCSYATVDCATTAPPLVQVAPRHAVRCLHWERIEPRAGERATRSNATRASAESILEVEALAAAHRTRGGVVTAASDVSFEVRAGECVALAGESGSGKSTIARCLAGLHTPSHGSIRLHGHPLPATAEKRTKDQRRRLQIVFQNPRDSLNPRRLLLDEVARPARILRSLSAREALRVAEEMFERVQLPRAIGDRYPRDVSGGEAQRAAVARALVAGPDLVVCDEITSALDVSVQAALLELLERLRGELGLSLLFISHDLGVISSVADRILILEKGTICEAGATSEVIAHPRHPYTRRLVAAAPSASRGRLPEGGP